ncbi:MAG: hypothetical protein D6681_00155 [Calditrichaeota bacterium]|nr:MAG: hypothetical protein D6681_00155 [Calditrichota bacterium]
MKFSIVSKRILPFVGSILLLFLGAIALGYSLHLLNAVWVGRYFGIVGTGLILLSFLYSLQKRGIIRLGSPKTLLLWHEYLTWTGALMILVHAGLQVNAILPWLAVLAMIIVVISGHLGKYILSRARLDLKHLEKEMIQRGLSTEEIEKKLLLDALVVKAMENWRALHFPFVALFASLAILHILVIFFFWNW